MVSLTKCWFFGQSSFLKITGYFTYQFNEEKKLGEKKNLYKRRTISLAKQNSSKNIF